MRLKSSLKLALLLVAGLFAMQMMAQTTTSGDLAGTVTDPSNAVVSGASISVTNVDTGSSYTTKTSSTGSYRAPSLKPGVYKVTVTQSGFRTTVETVTIALGAVSTANIQLQVGQGSETVEVTGAAPLIQTEDANISTAFTQKQVDLLPNGGNDLTAVAQTAPGVQMNTSSGGGYGNFTAFGLPATSNLFTVNGNDEMDPYLNLNNSGATNLLLGKNEVQETAVVSNGYTGQYGRMAGAQVDYSTKSGTNDWHGNAQYFYNSGGFNANDWFNNHTTPSTPLPEEVNNQWAASFGGPIKKDKLFFFFDTEGLRYILSTSNLAIVPTPQFGAAVVANIPTNSTVFGGPALGAASQSYYSNMFSLWDNSPGISRATPLAGGGCGDLNTFQPLAGLAGFGGAGLPCSESFRSTVGQLSKEWILAGRVDYNLSNSDKLFFRYRRDAGVQPTYTDIVSPVFNTTSNQPQDEGQVNWSHTFSPTILNSFILSGSWYSAFFGTASAQAAAAAQFPAALEDFDTSSWSNLGGISYDFPQGRNVTQYQIIDDVSVSKGAHSLKFGGNFRRNDITDGIFSVLTTPLMLKLSTTTFATGESDYIRERFPTATEQPMAIYSFGVYVQDEWKVSRDLKLTMTMRADRNSNTVCQTNCFSTLSTVFNELPHDPNEAYSSLIKTNQSAVFPNLEKIVFQPRAGFAWTPLGHSSTVLRGGVGLFSDLYPATLVDRFARNSPNLQDFTLEPVGGLNGEGFLPYAPGEAGSASAVIAGCNSTFINNYKAGGNATSFLAAAPAGCAVPNFNNSANNISNPKYVEWNFEIQQAIGAKTSLTLNYVGNKGYDEFVTNPLANVYSNPGISSIVNGLPTAPPDNHFRNVGILYNGAVSNYNGLTATASRRFTSGFTGNLNYTWSHALDDVSNGGTGLYYSANDSLLSQIDPACLRCLNYGNADYDVRHNITANYVWELPFKSSSKALNFVESGWTLSQTIFWHSGYPYSPFDGSAPGVVAGNSSSGVFLASFNGGAMSSGCSTPDTPCLLPSQFNAPGAETSFGNIARNSFRGASYFNSDFTLLKNFPITERVSFGLGATAYNVFNHASFSNPTSDISSGQFGTIQSTVVPPTSPYGAFVGSAVSGRLLQLQARVTF